jgi:hypothetical protein
MAVRNPALSGSWLAATDIFRTMGESTATAAPAVMVFETKTVRSDIAASNASMLLPAD